MISVADATTLVTQEMQMPKYQGEVIRDDHGREVVCFTTPSGVRAIVATDIPDAVLDKLIAKLKRKIARRRQAARRSL